MSEGSDRSVDLRVERAVVVYAPRLVAGVLALLGGFALVPLMIPVICVAGAVAGLYLWFLCRRRWKGRPAQPGTTESVGRKPFLTVVSPALPEVSLAVGAFVGSYFSDDGNRFALAGSGGALCGAMIGVAVGRFGEYGGKRVFVVALRIWFGSSG